MSGGVETNQQFEQLYRDYIAAINALHDTSSSGLAPYLAESVIHNDRHLDLRTYTALIDPTSEFRIMEIVCDVDKGVVAVRLEIEWPNGMTKLEDVFYKWDTKAKKIERVWSMVIDGPSWSS